jgi:prepilin-type N-terminal cleavage/methylation domain-containing protein
MSVAMWRDERGFTLTELLVGIAILGMVMASVGTVQLTSNSIFMGGENQAEVQQTARTAMLMEEEMRLIGYGVPAGQPRITAASATGITFSGDLLNASTRLAADVASGSNTFTVDPGHGIATGNTVYLINGDQFQLLTVSGVSGNTVTVSTPGGVAVFYPLGIQVGRPRTVSYAYTAGTRTLTKDAGDGAGAQTLATGVSTFQLRYFDTADAEILPANLTANLANIRRISVTITAQATASVAARTFSITANVRPRNL